MDNSGSMTGYLRKDAEFQGSITYILSQIDDNKNLIKINFISDSVTKFSGKIGEFIDKLSKAPDAGGHSSEMDKMITNIINHTDTDDISIFTSDCILSYTDNDIKKYRAKYKSEINKDKV